MIFIFRALGRADVETQKYLEPNAFPRLAAECVVLEEVIP
jgi:hypothetical protein